MALNKFPGAKALTGFGAYLVLPLQKEQDTFPAPIQSGWWLNQPIWKICSSQNWTSSPRFGAKIWKKYLSCHHLETQLRRNLPTLGKIRGITTPPPQNPSQIFGKHHPPTVNMTSSILFPNQWSFLVPFCGIGTISSPNWQGLIYLEKKSGIYIYIATWVIIYILYIYHLSPILRVVIYIYISPGKYMW